jgi:hypothetical protein
MAKDYIRTKNYITKFIEMKTHLNAVSLKMQVGSNNHHFPWIFEDIFCFLLYYRQ